ncbi:PREDICTED: DNA repair-scaffolding protein [Miniopterus natalensis]|uniref:DNA repair-scaffolding protein n=1 Tax=Miniopterus natalensis TaxID=291302 RepID=UPI0007A6B622|nr:PREDICTED: DNA repair-scaffolding protein [Miniopterus natalensis]
MSGDDPQQLVKTTAVRNGDVQGESREPVNGNSLHQQPPPVWILGAALGLTPFQTPFSDGLLHFLVTASCLVLGPSLRLASLSFLPRKRNLDIEYPSFPGERPLQFRRAGHSSVGAAASLSEAWLRCAEGFQDAPGTPSSTAEKETVTEKPLELFASPKKETTTSKSISGLTDITWSSSGSDRSDRDELQFVDWESDSDREDTSEHDEFEDGESAVEISDCASYAGSQSSAGEEGVSELPKTSSTEILEYSSDSESGDDSENVLFIDPESSHKYHTDFGSDGRQVMERRINPGAKSTDNILYTPQKQTKLPRTPENSANKKQLSRGGLAERLNGLQNRERSAISLWRHQCVSYQKTLSGSRSGVLIVKILELHEECALQVATCEQLVGLPADSPSQGEASGTGLKVLFSKETARDLRGRPQDIVQIYPPWQKLIIPNGSCPVILNTYFCQKVVAKEDSRTTPEVRSWDTPLPRRSITLAQTFRFERLTDNSPESQVMCGLTPTRTDWTHKHEEAARPFSPHAPLRDSLLETVESQGAGPGSGAGFPVVVQRVYSLPSRRQQGGGSAGAPSSDPPGARLCLLVQDAYGVFGEVHLEGPVLKDRWLEGRPCRLAGMKALQKATRGRTAGLFSLIDTMWPPVVPLKAPGHGRACEEVRTPLPPPSFCYILTAHPHLGQIDIIGEDPVSKLYQPPAPRSLREILQMADLSTRCSFYARVIYQRPLLNSLLLLEPREIWLTVTDVTLQMQDENSSGFPKTLPVCVTPSCVLGRDVLEVLAKAAPCSFFFRDALQDQGQIVCVERTVLLLPMPVSEVACGAHACELASPVELDELGPATQVNSICSVQGTVVGVDESTAFSWPTCDLCGNERLEQSPEDRGAFSCADCSRVVTAPLLRRHLQVFLHCPSRPQGTVRVKLAQSSISSLLRFAACEDGSYEARSVIGKEVGLPSCVVLSIATHPTRGAGLEEIELLRAGSAS